MDWDTFDKKYPDISELLSDDFQDRASPEHRLKNSISRDYRRDLRYIEKLIRLGPAKEIKDGSYKNNLFQANQFRAFISELKAYFTVNMYICGAEVSDTIDTSGKPDLSCKFTDLDIEVIWIGQGASIFRIRRAIEDIFDDTDGIHATISAKMKYIKIPQTYDENRKNNEYENEVISKLQDIDDEPLPIEINTEAILVELEDTESDNVSISIASGLTGETMIDFEDIEKKLDEKVEKQRKNIPLLLFLDTNLSLFDHEMMEKIVIGERTTELLSNVDFGPDSNLVKQRNSIWHNYLSERNFMNSPRVSYVKPGKEGLFVDSQYEYVAGIVFIDEAGISHVVPNIYTDSIDVKKIYEDTLHHIHEKTIEKTIIRM